MHTDTQVHSNTITLLGKSPSSIIHGHVLASDCAGLQLNCISGQYSMRQVKEDTGRKVHNNSSLMNKAVDSSVRCYNLCGS